MNPLKLIISIVAGVFALMGLVFFLQGIGLLPGSFMTGQAQWALIGLVLIVIGGSVIGYNLRGMRR